jgi:hypothetical protein
MDIDCNPRIALPPPRHLLVAHGTLLCILRTADADTEQSHSTTGSAVGIAKLTASNRVDEGTFHRLAAC